MSVLFVFLALLFILVFPVGLVVLTAMAVKWAKIIFGIITGDEEVIQDIKENTCEAGRKKNESWGSWWERKFDSLVLPRDWRDSSYYRQHNDRWRDY